jgi:FkbM family methyltransferase
MANIQKRYTQNYEQEVIEDFFKDTVGTLWDFGCNDGITLSNTYDLLFNKGWKGTIVDASDVCIERARAIYSDRPDVQVLNLGIATENTTLEFYESGHHLSTGDWGLVSSFIKGTTARWESSTTYTVKKVPCYSFQHFLDNLTVYKTVNFISIDIEGMDYDVLSQINLDQTETKLLCIEHTHRSYDIQEYAKQFGFSLLSQNAENVIMGR